jgi:putative membrane protein
VVRILQFAKQDGRGLGMSYTPWMAALTAASALGAIAQTPTRDTIAPQNQGIVTAEAQRPDAAASRDIDFLTDALRTALAEARMGELAAERGAAARVREYGATLQRDSAQHADEIRRQLEPLNVTIPSEPSAEALSHHAALTRLSAEELDAAFIQMMIWTHTEAIEKYGAQTHANPNRALSDFASMSLPMLRAHLAAAEMLR